MIYTIESEMLKVSASTRGAELTSITCKKTGIEYLWQGDEASWESQAPVLFPFVARMKNFKYNYMGKEYNMNLHGFARHSEFEVSATDDQLVFTLTDSPETKKGYPFAFKLDVIFTLNGDCLLTEYRVTNPSATEDLLFGIGAHPGFNCPLVPGTVFEDYYLEFENVDSLTSHDASDRGLLLETSREVSLTNSCLPLTLELFKKFSTVLLVDSPVKKVAIKSDKCPQSVTMTFDAQHLAMWTFPAPFVCLEPWDGLPDYESTNGDFATKKANQKLPPGGIKSYKHNIYIR